MFFQNHTIEILFAYLELTGVGAYVLSLLSFLAVGGVVTCEKLAKVKEGSHNM